MTVAFYLDEHVPLAIHDGLRDRGIDVLTVQDDGRVGFSDTDLLDRATALGRVMFTRDTDFLKEAAARQNDSRRFSGVVYAHQLRLSIGECVGQLELIGGACDPAELENLVLHLPIT